MPAALLPLFKNILHIPEPLATTGFDSQTAPLKPTLKMRNINVYSYL